MTEETITEFKRDVVDPMLAEPESGGLSLNDVGNGDEWWFDLNKILQSKTVGPRGEEHRQEVPGERSAHVTVFSGAHSYQIVNAGIDITTYDYLLYYCKPFVVKVGDGKIN